MLVVFNIIFFTRFVTLTYFLTNFSTFNITRIVNMVTATLLTPQTDLSVEMYIQNNRETDKQI